MKKTLIATAVGLTLMGAGVANAALVTDVFGNGPGTYATDRANFTMLQPDGSIQPGGANDVVMTWDGNAYNNISDYTGLTSVSNVTAVSDATFSSFLWTAHNIQVFTPGSYTFNTASPGGNAEAGNLVLNVGTGQLGVHMLFDWGGAAATSCGVANCNIDVAVLAAPGVPFFGSGVGTFGTAASVCTAPGSNCLWNSGPANSFAGGSTLNRPAGNQSWMLTSIDGNADGTPGIPMAAGGPFGGFNANFNANLVFTSAVPVPAAVWLLGSGLLGLVGIARRKKSA